MPAGFSDPEAVVSMIAKIEKNFFKMKRRQFAWILSAQVILSWAYVANAGFNPNCVSCQLLERMKSTSPVRSVLTETSSENLNLGWNVANIVNRPSFSDQPSPLQFVGQGNVSELSSGQKWWDGQGELINGFKRPWELPQTNYDPSFVTPYYTSQKGPIQGPWAPWSYSQGLLSYPYSYSVEPYLSQPFRSYLGGPSFSF